LHYYFCIGTILAFIPAFVLEKYSFIIGLQNHWNSIATTLTTLLHYYFCFGTILFHYCFCTRTILFHYCFCTETILFHYWIAKPLKQYCNSTKTAGACSRWVMCKHHKIRASKLRSSWVVSILRAAPTYSAPYILRAAQAYSVDYLLIYFRHLRLVFLN
jgi:hypothetical protein